MYTGIGAHDSHPDQVPDWIGIFEALEEADVTYNT